MSRLLVLLCFALFCSCPAALAQKYAVKGSVTDEKASALPSATVLLLHPKDSAAIYNTLTTQQGSYEIRNVIRGEYLLKVSYLGFNSFFKKITLSPAQATLEVPPVKLLPMVLQLGEVQVQGERSPVVYKRDTVEFNANSFKTEPNAAVEDLVKKLPGIEVDEKGAVKAQGEKITKVLVDGKEFFGKDPAIALKNLPANAIDKVQVVDEKSEQAKFSGVDDGHREKILNLTLKKEHKQMGFGKASLGVGTDNRYQGNLNYNRFNQGNQLSVLGMGNNVNQQGFSYEESQQFSNGEGRQNQGEDNYIMNNANQRGVPINFGDRNNGNTHSNAGGLNFFQKVNKKLELNGSYFLNHMNQETRRFGSTESVLPLQGSGNSGRFFSTDSSFSTRYNLTHTVNLSADYKLDSLNSLKVISNFSLSANDYTGKGNNERLSETGEVYNQNRYTSDNEGDSFNGSLQLLFRHRFRTKGRSFTATARLGGNQNENEGRSISRSQVRSGQVQHFNRQNEYGSESNYSSLNLSYTEPLSKKTFLEGNYSVNNNQNGNQGDIYDLVDEQRYRNDTLSTNSEQNNLTQKVGFSLRGKEEKYNFSVGAGLQQIHQEGDFQARGAMTLSRTYLNLLPVANFNYDFSKFHHLRFYYSSYVNTPQLTMVQPLVRQFDLLNIYLPNEQLRPSVNNYFNLNFNTYNPVSGIYGYAGLSSGYALNPFSQAINLDQDLVRTMQWVNMRNSFSHDLHANVGLPIKKIKGMIHLGPNAGRRINYSQVNGQTGQVAQNSVGGNMGFNFNLKDKFSFRANASLRLQRSVYELNKERNLETRNSQFSTEANWHVKKNFRLNSNFNLTRYQGTSSNFNQTLPMWNMWVTKQFLKNKTGELKLSAYNLLNRNLGIEQYAYEGNVSRATVNSLGSYYLLSFTYSLNRKMNGPKAVQAK
ncbi:MAG: outer membrane beta-barrel protein [Adhaeribacter sp.]